MSEEFPPARTRCPEVFKALIEAQRYPGLAHRILRMECQEERKVVVTANYIREQTRLHGLSLARLRQQEILDQWRQSHAEILRAFEQPQIFVSAETKEMEERAERVLRTAKLGVLLLPGNDLGQRRRSQRTASQLSVEEQQSRLTARIASLEKKL
jgi:hypothetical protein